MNKKYFFILILIGLIFWFFSHNKLQHSNVIAIQKTSKLLRFKLPSFGYEKSKIVELIAYNDEIYNLAFKIYLQNQNVPNAYAVAFAAVQQLTKTTPKNINIIWRQRLAQVSLWNHQPILALQQYLYLAQNFQLKSAIINGLKLANSFHDDDSLSELSLLMIRHIDNAEKNWQEYVDAMLRLGNFEQLARVMQENHSNMSQEFYLRTQIKISNLIGDIEQQLQKFIQYTKSFGVREDLAIKMAKIYIKNGDLKRAFDILQQAHVTSKSTNLPNTQAFWESYVQVAYLINNQRAELYGYQQLLKQPKPFAQTYNRLVELTFNRQPFLSYKYAIIGRKLYPKSFFLHEVAFALLEKMNHLQDFKKLYDTTPKSIKKMLQHDNVFWSMRAKYFLQQNNLSAAIASTMQGIKILPHDDYLKSDLLIMLIEQGELSLLANVLNLWQDNLQNKPILWGNYIQGLVALNHMQLAKLVLNLFYKQIPIYRKNPYWLINFKDNLDAVTLALQSAAVANYAWPLFLQMLLNQNTEPDYTQLLNYVKLSMIAARGDPTAIALTQLQKYVNQDVALLMLSYALSHNNFSLATKMYWFYKENNIDPPHWITIGLALHRNDRQLMRKLLISKKPIIAYRDRVRSAKIIEAIPLAQTIAYEELKRHRHDQDLYDDIYTPLMLSTADSFFVGQDSYQFGSVAGPRNDLSYTHYLFPSLSIMPYNSIWWLRDISNHITSTPSRPISATSNLVLVNVPPHDERTGAQMILTAHRGKYLLDVGYRNELTSFVTAKLSRSYKLFYDLDTTTTLGFNQPAEDTVSLLVGAKLNSFKFEFNKNLTIKDSISGNYLQKDFHTQDGQYLSAGSQGTLRYDHKLRLTFPDLTLSPYGVFATYYEKSHALLTGKVLSIIPKSVTPNVNFFIPNNFTEYGLVASFGQNYIDEYTHRWQPFALATISKNSVVGVGELINIGMAGTVFGKDHLLLYYEWGSNQGQGLQNVVLGRISYRIYV